MDFVKKDIETKALGNGGCVVKRVPQGNSPEVFTIKLYDVSNDLTGTYAGFYQYFHPQTADDDTDPVVVENSLDRDTYQLVFLQCSQLPLLPTTAGGATPTNASAHRITMKNVYITEYKFNKDDKQLSSEVTFKWAPFTKAGVSNKKVETTDGSATLPTVTSFT